MALSATYDVCDMIRVNLEGDKKAFYYVYGGHIGVRPNKFNESNHLGKPGAVNVGWYVLMASMYVDMIATHHYFNEGSDLPYGCWVEVGFAGVRSV